MTPEVPVNYLAVIASAISNMVVGTLWFGPLFGKQWIAMMGFTKEQIEKAKTAGMQKTYAMAAVGALLMAYVMSHTLTFASTYMQVSGPSAGGSTGFWMWLGFAVPITMSSVLWEGKSWKLWGLTSGYYLVSLIIMGLILASWR